MALLEIDEVHVFYDNIEALKGVSIKVETKQIVTLVGANGAGKTTTLRAISGLLHPRSGEIRLDGEKLGDFAPHEIAAMGLLQVPEGRRIFARLTIEENLAMGAFARQDRQAAAHQLVVVGLVAGGDAQLCDPGPLGHADPDLRNQDAFEVEAEHVHAIDSAGDRIGSRAAEHHNARLRGDYGSRIG